MTTANRWTLLVGVAVSVLVGGGVSYLASSDPDGLEAVQEQLGVTPAHSGIAPPPTPFEGYRVKGLGDGFGSNAAAGVAGSLLVLGLVLGIGYVLRRGRARPATDPGATSHDP